MDFAVDYQLSQGELARAYRQSLRRQIRLLSWGLPAVFLAGAAICALAGAGPSTAGLTAGALVAPIATEWAHRQRLRRMAVLLCLPATIRVTSDGYEVRTELSTVMVRWTMFGRMESTPEFWLLYRSRLFVMFLPRAAFNEAQRAGIDNIVASHPVAA